MGSCPFQTVAYGNTASEAYQNAVEEANAVNGHQDGYSGDIQTTEGFEMVPLETGKDIEQMVDETIDQFSKWGPCGCIQLNNNRYLFFGWAAD